MPAFPKPTATETDPVASPTAAAALALAGTKAAKASNLSDLTDASAARTNLGLGTSATLDVDTTTTLGTSDTKVPSQKAVKTYVDGATPADASTTVKGIAKASVAPVSAAAPIFVGDNDPRVRPGMWMPADYGLIAYTYDPERGTTPNSVNNQINLDRIPIHATVTLSNLVVSVVYTSGTLTAGQNLLGVYNSAGTLIAKTADQTTPWSSTGVKTAALIAESGQSLTGTFDYITVAILQNGGSVTFHRSNQSPATAIFNQGFSSPYRAAYKGGQTSIPSTVPTGLAVGVQPFWIGVS